MKKISLKSVSMVLSTLLACSVLSGCYTIKRLICKEEPVDVTAMAKYWDGPRVGPGITLNIVLSSGSTTPVTMSALVDQNGDITLPHLLTEPVHCDGLSLDGLRQELVKRYSEFYRQPLISVTFGAWDGRSGVSPWGTVMVMGEVGTPGPVNMPATMDLTITKVLQLAGNLKPYADKTSIVVTRCDKDGKRTQIDVDLRDIGQGGRADLDIALRAGDVVYVPESWY